MSRFAWLIVALFVLCVSLLGSEAQAGPLARGAAFVFRGGKAVVSKVHNREPFHPLRRAANFLAGECGAAGHGCTGDSCR